MVCPWLPVAVGGVKLVTSHSAVISGKGETSGTGALALSTIIIV